MTEDTKLVDQKALDSLSVAPGNPDDAKDIHDPRQNAGQDESIAKRLERNPDSPDAALDNALDESMDASDPPSNTQPGDNGAAPKSSGYDSDAEAKRASDAD
ncbi:hypothetical protein E2E30_10455 [Sphingomonas sp. AAP5]|jgi:hypothetical protein|uniref:Uncharacterized protein n=1 Tax=Sphingomonas glacialis TaxID=658225 RepID=A0ABQ3LBJ6_9SPHN|nr:MULTISPECIES: hypothetical protein [Sphingomonas]MDY7525035.1 hypothetical protein [Sphingomonas sp. 10B4]MEB0281526.1 hypothetical protein [Sphingomonas sp. 10B4]QBM76142.1 hypothetical protein E2E30_10455 [Sphingomonas sp. AAP5]GHH11210.1 hypothetical protein GCM10008023_09900 [Sphingomonas glacialis]